MFGGRSLNETTVRAVWWLAHFSHCCTSSLPHVETITVQCNTIVVVVIIRITHTCVCRARARSIYVYQPQRRRTFEESGRSSLLWCVSVLMKSSRGPNNGGAVKSVLLKSWEKRLFDDPKPSKRIQSVYFSLFFESLRNIRFAFFLSHSIFYLMPETSKRVSA